MGTTQLFPSGVRLPQKSLTKLVNQLRLGPDLSAQRDSPARVRPPKCVRRALRNHRHGLDPFPSNCVNVR
jgi:hypothetical protein